MICAMEGIGGGLKAAIEAHVRKAVLMVSSVDAGASLKAACPHWTEAGGKGSRLRGRSAFAHAVWLYFCFSLKSRLVEEMLLDRGIVVSYETVRRRAMKFGPSYARRIRRKTPSPRDIWHLDEVVITIAGQQPWLWRAVDQDGYVLDEIVQTRRDTKAPNAC